MGIRSQQGSVAVVVAFFLVGLLMMFAFVLNTGYLYGEKNTYQNAAEAAAMAGAARLCDGDAIEVATQVAKDNGAPQGSVTVTPGFYDEEGEQFFAEGSDGYPEDEYNNAVMVRLDKDEDTLMGGFVGKDKVKIRAVAVAYLKRYSMVSLNENGDIRLRATSFNNGNIYANGDIKMAASPQRPQFNDVNLFAGGEVLECPRKRGMWGMPTNEIDWDKGSVSSLGNSFPGSPLVDDIRPLDDEYVNHLKNESDVVYHKRDAGSDEIFYGECAPPLVPPVHAYFFDLTGDHFSRVTYFFDASGVDESGNPVVAYISARPYCSVPSIDHPTPNGGSDIVKNITFIARCPVIIDHVGPETTHFGGENDEQVIIISLSDITVYNSDLFLDGAYFRCGGDFKIAGSAVSSDYNKMRVIADDSIEIDYISEYDFLFGPPCPPSIPKLGKLSTNGN